MLHKEKYSESLADLLIATLGSARSIRRFRSILRERKIKRYKKGSVRVTLSRLHKKDYVTNSTLGWSITRKGKKYKKNIHPIIDYVPSPFKKNAPANTIIAFDIPEQKRATRNWLRNQIKIFNYKMLQQSLWIGPGPLPLSFFKCLEDLKIRKNIKTFRITKKNNNPS